MNRNSKIEIDLSKFGLKTFWNYEVVYIDDA